MELVGKLTNNLVGVKMRPTSSNKTRTSRRRILWKQQAKLPRISEANIKGTSFVGPQTRQMGENSKFWKFGRKK